MFLTILKFCNISITLLWLIYAPLFGLCRSFTFSWFEFCRSFWFLTFVLSILDIYLIHFLLHELFKWILSILDRSFRILFLLILFNLWFFCFKLYFYWFTDLNIFFFIFIFDYILFLFYFIVFFFIMILFIFLKVEYWLFTYLYVFVLFFCLFHFLHM